MGPCGFPSPYHVPANNVYILSLVMPTKSLLYQINQTIMFIYCRCMFMIATQSSLIRFKITRTRSCVYIEVCNAVGLQLNCQKPLWVNRFWMWTLKGLLDISRENHSNSLNLKVIHLFHLTLGWGSRSSHKVLLLHSPSSSSFVQLI